MSEILPLVLKNGKIQQLDFPNDTIEGDFLSGTNLIPEDKVYTIPETRQSINFIMLTLDGDLNLNGDLWLA